MESDTFNGDVMLKSMWRLSGIKLTLRRLESMICSYTRV